MTPRRPSTLAALALAAIALLALFVANARWGSSANVDVVATDVPAWNLVDRSSLDLSDYPDPNPWFVEDRFGRIVSDRAPGLFATALPTTFNRASGGAQIFYRYPLEALAVAAIALTVGGASL